MRFYILIVFAGILPGLTVAQVTAPAGVAPAPAAEVQSPPLPAAPAPAAKPLEPDYPDPRTMTLGLFYWFTGPGSNPNLGTGHNSGDFSTLKDLGKDHRTPGLEFSIPVSRTGAIHFEAFESKGDGNQTAPANTTLFATAISKGDFLATQYQIRDGRIYLDDLLFPHRFPVSRFRLKSLWAVQYLNVHAVVDAPAVLAGETGEGSRNIILPTLGLAAEYALTPHLLFRADASGFGLYHRADFWDAEVTIAWRRGNVEIVGGGKTFHFKTSPQNTQFLEGTMAGAFVGARWHF